VDYFPFCLPRRLLNLILLVMCFPQECTSEVEVWHDDVQFYKIFNKDGNTVVLLLVLYACPPTIPKCFSLRYLLGNLESHVVTGEVGWLI